MDIELFAIQKSEDDFSRHNTEQKTVWDGFHKGDPPRMPMVLGVNPRFLLCDRRYNRKNITFREYMTQPDLMLRVQCEFAYFKRHYLYFDQEMGLPEQWHITVDTQNIAEAAWFGAEIVYPEDEVPSTRVLLTEDNKNCLFEKGLPDPFSGYYGQVKHTYEYLKARDSSFLNRPVDCDFTGLGTDGPMTLACNLRGAAEFCMDLYLDTEFALQLLDYLTQATIRRIQAWYAYYGAPLPPGAWFADDSVALLSTEDYVRFVLPFHKKLLAGISSGTGPHAVHLCGDATRHFATMHHELNIDTFDTGYPVDHGDLVRALGESVTVQGGPTIDLLRNGGADEVRRATADIIRSVKPVSKKFIMREANNLPPGTPLGNIEAMYETVREYGRY